MTETNAPKLVISLWALVSISLVFVALRLLCKGRYSKGYCWDDYLLTAAWVSLVNAARKVPILLHDRSHFRFMRQSSQSPRPMGMDGT
jgi:hypothetical protein